MRYTAEWPAASVTVISSEEDQLIFTASPSTATLVRVE